MSAGKTLFVWQEETGVPVISQNGGVDSDVIERYRKGGRNADFLERGSMDISRVFIRNGKFYPRPKILARLDKQEVCADGQDYARLRGVPAGGLVTVSDGLVEQREVSNGSDIFITTLTPGRLTITIEAAPHIPQTLQITAK